MSVLVTALRLRNRFLPGYAGRLARSYEGRRDNRRWQGESEAFERLYARANPVAVIDCPVGTGRWLGHYRKSGASVLGIDFSEHMLAEAEKKIEPSESCRLMRGDTLDPQLFRSVEGSFDLIVCTRFVHWLTPRDVEALVANFSQTGARFMLIGARVTAATADHRPRAEGQSGWSRLKRHIRGRLHRNVVHVHDEERLLGIFRTNGWSLVEKVAIPGTRQFRYFFYLLERARPS